MRFSDSISNSPASGQRERNLLCDSKQRTTCKFFFQFATNFLKRIDFFKNHMENFFSDIAENNEISSRSSPSFLNT